MQKTVIRWYFVTGRYGKRNRFSLQTVSRTKAKTLLYKKIKSGDLWPAKGTSIRLLDFAQTIWDWENGTYIQCKRVRVERITLRPKADWLLEAQLHRHGFTH